MSVIIHNCGAPMFTFTTPIKNCAAHRQTHAGADDRSHCAAAEHKHTADWAPKYRSPPPHTALLIPLAHERASCSVVVVNTGCVIRSVLPPSLGWHNNKNRTRPIEKRANLNHVHVFFFACAISSCAELYLKYSLWHWGGIRT